MSFKLLSLLALGAVSTHAFAVFVPVDFYSSATRQLSFSVHTAGGSQTLGGVMFQLPTSGNDIWEAAAGSSSNPRVLSVSGLSVPNAVSVYSLMNTYYGTPGPTSYLKIEITGTGGASYTKELFGNVDVRDYLQNTFTNSINGTSTVEVLADGRTRLDRQKYDLPASFLGQNLTGIKIIDNGDTNVQRAYVHGLTIETVPEPASMIALGLGLVAFARRKRA